MRAWYAKHRGTARDLPDLYRTLIAAIRSVDADTPLMLDAGWYAAADAFAYWPAPLDDAALLYGFHMYEPYAATSARSDEHTSELQSLMRLSYAVFCLKKNKIILNPNTHNYSLPRLHPLQTPHTHPLQHQP